MKHNIKLPDGTIQTIDCLLGSGIVDCNGEEIFEGDKVLDANGDMSTVTWDGGSLIAPNSFVEDLGTHIEGFFEIVGH
ncbi:MAG: hypothetical protein IJ774_07390 [Selenomonadaceae bacterium]|nr:hypothetical protein [Selenomonadaceae bacterium]